MAEVPAGSLGPRLVATEGRDVMVWAVPSGDASGLYASLAHGNSAPIARRVAEVDPTLRQLSVGTSNEGDILVLGVHKSAGNEVLTSTRLGPEGAYQLGPQVLATTPSSIVYTKVVPTALGAVAVWVERAAGAADLYTVLIDEKGPRRPHRLVRGITAWQVTGGDGSVTIATREGLEAPALRVRQVGDRGEMIGSPIEIARNVAGGKDLDVAVSQDRILVAYSDQGAYESHLVGALLDASGNVLRAGFPLTEPRGEQALLSVRKGEGGSFWIAWHEPRHAYHDQPSVLLGKFATDSFTVQPGWAIRAARKDALLPLFASHEGGISALVDVKCTVGLDSCLAPLARVALRIQEKGAAHSKLLAISGDRSPALSWDLSCVGDDCRYLLSDGGTPAGVYLGRVDSEELPWGGLVEREPESGPVLLSHVTLGEIPELSELEGAAWDDGARSLLAWVSYFEPDLPYVIPEKAAPDGRRAPVRARLSTVAPGNQTDTAQAETVISYRARSLGGVHLVAPEKNRGLLVWSALDQKVPQLFATIIDAGGKKITQKMLTRSRAEVTDVSATRVSGGYLLAWIEEDKESARLLALRVSDTLVPSGNPRVVSQKAITPSGVALLTTEQGVVCVWSDARAAGSEANADLYSMQLDSRTGAPTGIERRLTVGDAHAHSPRLSKGSNGETFLAWLSESPGSNQAQFQVAPLGREGALTETRAWRPSGDARDFSLECSGGECRAVVVVVVGQDSAMRTSLWALRLPLGAAIQERKILPLWASGAEGVSPALLGDNVYFADSGSHDAGWHLRRASIRWE